MNMGIGENRITKATMIGWILTIAISLGGAWMAVNARVYEVEKQIDLLKLQMSTEQVSQARQDKSLDEIHSMFQDIKNSMTDMNGKMNMKADRKYIN